MIFMKRIDFENGNIVSNILKAALPMLVAQIMSLLYNIVDRVYIARIPDVGTTALGAVGLCFPIIVIITAFSNLFGTGGAPIFSIERGKGNHAKAGLLMNTSFTLLALCAVILMIVGLLFARPILVLFGASDAGLAYAYPYLMIYLLGTFPSMAATGMNPFINAQGYATTGMTSVIIGAVANLLLDPLFILYSDSASKAPPLPRLFRRHCLLPLFCTFYTTKQNIESVFFPKPNWHPAVKMPKISSASELPDLLCS